MNTIANINQTLEWRKGILVLGVLFLLLLMPEMALAQATKFGGKIDDLGVTGVTSTNSMTKNIALIVAFIGFIAIMAAFATGIPGIIMTFFANINDARKNDDWGPLMRFLAMALVVILLAFVFIALYNTFVVDQANALK